MIKIYENKDFFDRPTSFLEFNKRVQNEAVSDSNPLLEKLMFLAIVTSNLDQFVMVRIAGLKMEESDGDKEKGISGLLPSQVLKELSKRMHSMVDENYKIYHKLIEEVRIKTGIAIKNWNELSKKEKDSLDKYFDENIHPLMNPQVLSNMHPFPQVPSGQICIVSALEKKDDKGDTKTSYGIITANGKMERLIALEGEKDGYILAEDLIRHKLDRIYPNFDIKDTAMMRITRNEDMAIDEDEAEDYLIAMEKAVIERNWGKPIRLEICKNSDDKGIQKLLIDTLEIDPDDVYQIDGPLDLSYLWEIRGLKGYSKYQYPPLVPRFRKKLEEEEIFDTLKKESVVLLHPYDSFYQITKFLETSSTDPNVMFINMTLYRVRHGDSPIVNALIKAAQNGKQVRVLVEVKARFDEIDNIKWAQELEKAGCQVIYGKKDLKVHAKTIMVVRKEGDKMVRYAQMGTGNYLKEPYVDLSLFTADKDTCEDLAHFFNMLSGAITEEEVKWKKLGVGPKTLEPKFISLIDREIAHAKAGKPAKIIAKMNGFTNRKMIEKVYEASANGVEVILIVRGDCCLLPGIKDVSEKVSVYSIVGRFLEHNRVYYFKNAGAEEYYLASADWMTRNLHRRVEIMFPVESKKNREKLKEYLENILKDNVKRRVLKSDGTYEMVKREKDEKLFNYQEYYLNHKL